MLRVLTISQGDDEGIDEGEPLLVAKVDGPLIRRVLSLLTDHLADPDGPRPAERHGVLPLRPVSESKNP
jgi:hypothetical protein